MSPEMFHAYESDGSYNEMVHLVLEKYLELLDYIKLLNIDL